jgi:hypothetical protein
MGLAVHRSWSDHATTGTCAAAVNLTKHALPVEMRGPAKIPKSRFLMTANTSKFLLAAFSRPSTLLDVAE